MKKTLVALVVLCSLNAIVACDSKPQTEEKPDETATKSETETETKANDVPQRPEKADPADWCGGHALPESMCTKCNPGLTEKFKAAGDWCAPHELPESVCPKCNPLAPPGEDSHEGHGHGANDWCGGHGLPESKCTKCNRGLIPKFKEAGDWCAEHGFPESACPECNPQTPPGEGGHEDHGHESGVLDWCAGHDLPESKCTKCNPELTEKFKDAGDWCAEHGFPESACPKCNPQTPPTGFVQPPFKEGTIVRLKAADHEDTVGTETQKARSAELGVSVEAPARVEFDQNLVATVRAPVPGIVTRVLVDLGARVEKNDALFVLESARVGDMQAQIVSAREAVNTARANVDRKKGLRDDGVASTREVEIAAQNLEETKSRLQSLQSSLRLAGAGSKASSGRFTVRAPIDGTVVERPAVMGTAADDTTPLATLADPSRMWVIIDVPEVHATQVALGQRVLVHPPRMPDETSNAEVTWVSPVVDPRTRTVRARAEVQNKDGRLRANQFVTAKLELAPAKSGVVIPRDAIQRVDGTSVVFVRKETGVYEPRAIEVLSRSGEDVQVRGALATGEPVVTTGAFLLKTELMRDSIGAGCCEVPED